MKQPVIFVACLIVVLSGTISSSRPASAASIMTNWISAQNIQHEYLPDQNPDTCTKGIWSIETDPGQRYPEPQQSSPHEVCVYHQKDFVYAYFTRTYGYAPVYYTESKVAIALGDNIAKGILTPISNMSQPDLLHQPLSNDLYMDGWTETYSGQYVYRMRNFPEHLSYDDHYHTYSYTGSPEVLTDNGAKIRFYGFGISSNGKWLVGTTADSLLRYDLQSDKVLRIGMMQYFSSSMWPSPTTAPFVSNDGTALGTTGSQGFTIVEADDNCLKQAADYEYPDGSARSVQLITPCKVRDLTSFVYNYVGQSSLYSGGARSISNTSINVDNSSITFMSREISGIRWHRISYKPQPVLQYLALGDSFASGEGDVSFDGVDHYFTGTNVYGDYLHNKPRENCRQSDRSYAMRITQSMGLTRGDDMYTVACSGAVIQDVLSLDKGDFIDLSYLGQYTNSPTGFNSSMPRLDMLTNPGELQDQARENYQPGRVQ